MKKNLITIITLLLFSTYLYSQKVIKPILDTNDLKNFATLIYSHYSITNNGQYIGYKKAFTEFNAPPFDQIIFKSLNSLWEKEVDSVEGGFTLTDDNKFAVFKKASDKSNVLILHLGTDIIDSYPEADEYHITKIESDDFLITYSNKKKK